MAKFIVEIDLDNAAFDNDAFDPVADELSRLLRRVAARVEIGDPKDGKLLDFNGNTVGTYRVEA